MSDVNEKTLLRAEELYKVYQSVGVSCTAVNRVSLRIERGDFICVVGPSGSGKSSLLYMLAGIMKPDSGQLFWGNKSVLDMTEKARAEYRGREAGFVYQDGNLIDDLNILCNVSLPGYLYERRRVVDTRGMQWLKYLGLAEHRNKFPKELSGGQRQKAAIARALINRPKILFLDEPTGSLDITSGGAVLDMLVSMNGKGQSIVMVTHDIGAAARGNKVLVIRDGRIYRTLELGKYDGNGRTKRESMIYQIIHDGGENL